MQISNLINKKSKFLLIVFSLFSLAFVSSCGSDDDDNNSVEQWKAFNETLLKDTIASGRYNKELPSASWDGSVYYRSSNNMKLIEIADPGSSPLSTDSVICRYEGWYYDMNYKKVLFDGTEGDYNQQAGKYIVLNGKMGNLYSYTTPIGVRDILQIMHIGDEYEIVLPYRLSSGASGIYGASRYTTNQSSVQLVPSYTTVFYRIKLLKIYRRTTTGD